MEENKASSGSSVNRLSFDWPDDIFAADDLEPPDWSDFKLPLRDLSPSDQSLSSYNYEEQLGKSQVAKILNNILSWHSLRIATKIHVHILSFF